MSGEPTPPALDTTFGAGGACVLATRPGIVEQIGQLDTCHRSLWTLEDHARSRTADDRRIAEIKRGIDRCNGERHRIIDRIDADFAASCAIPDGNARLYSETIGELCDRLLIVGLKMDNLSRLRIDDGLDVAEQQACAHQLSRYGHWRTHLQACFTATIMDFVGGRAMLPPRAERKLYNDVRLNPVTRREMIHVTDQSTHDGHVAVSLIHGTPR